MKYSACVFIKYILSILSLLLPLKILAADVYGPKPFNQILGSDLTKTWSPAPISAIQNREHVLFVDAETMSNCLTVDPSGPSLLGVGDVSVLTGGTGTYGNAVRSMFQVLDLNTAVLATESLTGTYTIHPWLASYHAIDADADTASGTASSILISNNDRVCAP